MNKPIESLNKHLTVQELLSIRGINNQAWHEFSNISKLLPKVGLKLFEPDHSLLQNKQLESALESRRDVLRIERVNKLNNLSIAEWLPAKQKAKVIKKAGVDWSNYGHVISKDLYLYPEEALLLLEMNCLELLYNNVSLSVQQAYELLIGASVSAYKLNEYLVFSQLTRAGYLLRRFQDVKSNKKNKVISTPATGVQSNDFFQSITSEHLIVKDVLDSVLDKIEIEIKKEVDEKSNESKSLPRLIVEEIIIDPCELTILRDTNRDVSKKKSANSWKELKEVKEVDENASKSDDEVEFIKATVKPLVNFKSVTNYRDIYNRLQIFKESYSTVRRKKKVDFNVSYEVYSKALQNKKSTDSPLFDLVVASEKNKIVQLIDLVKLEQDINRKDIMFAYLSGSSVSFIQVGFVSLPNLISK